MLEYTCLQQTSIVFEFMGNLIMLLICTRGVDSAERPSVFFYEAVLVRIMLVIAWSISHFLLSFFDTRALGTDLLKANIILDMLRAVVHCVQLYFHRYWCIGAGWECLKRRDAFQFLESWLRFGIFLAGVGSVAGNIFIYHTPDQPQYVANILFQTLNSFVSWSVVYTLRHKMTHGHFWLCCVAVTVAETICLTIGFVCMHFLYGASLGFDDPFGYLAQIVMWILCSAFSLACFFDSSFARLYSGPGCANPQLTNEVTPFTSTPALLSPAATLNNSITPHCLHESSGSTSDSLSQNDLFGLMPGSVATAEETVPTAISIPNPISLVSVVDDAECVNSSPSQHSVTEVSKFIHIPALPQSVSIYANPVLLMIHRAVLYLSEFLLFGGMIFLCDALIAAAYPSLPKCAQSDPFGNGLSSALRTLFDLFT